MNTAKIMKFERPEAPTEGKRMEGGFIQIPNDIYRAGKRFLKGNELRVFLEIVDKTYGFGKREDDMTIQQIADGLDINRKNASVSYRKLIELGVISSRKGKYGQITSINPISDWAWQNATNVANCHGQNTTNVANCHGEAWQIATHNIQLPKDNTSSLSPAPDGLTTEGAGGDEKPKPPDPPEKPKKKEKPKAPFEEIVAAYNEVTCRYLPEAQELTDERRKTVNARWQQFLNTTDSHGRVRYHDNESGLKWWRSFFRKVLLNDRWTGASGLAWTADFDWIVKKSNFVKILEWRPAQHGGNGNAH